MEAYQFMHDASMCDAWLNQQNSLINDLPIESCKNVSQAEELLRRINSYEKASKPWEERFAALEKLTEVNQFLQQISYCVLLYCSKLFFYSSGKLLT